MDRQKHFITGEQSLIAAFKSFKAIGFERSYTLTLRPLTRTDAQNKKLHALFSDIARQATWQGQKLTADEWKILLISGHTIATKENCRMVIGLEGEVVSLRESSAQMSVARMTSLIEYVTAWAVGNGVRLSDD